MTTYVTDSFVAEVSADLSLLSVAIEDGTMPVSLARLSPAQREIIIIAADILADVTADMT